MPGAGSKGLIEVREVSMQFPKPLPLKEALKNLLNGGEQPFIEVLENVSFSVNNGEFVSIVGPSGCGKTTLLKIICGLKRPTSGEVLIGGTPVNGPREDVGILFQSPALLEWATVLDNVLFPIRVKGLNSRDYRSKSLSLLRAVGLEGFENHYPRQLSGGMRQRVALVRAFMHDPRILLMDEPFGALDALTKREMDELLERIWNDRRKTILFVTHDVREAVYLSDRVLVMDSRPARIRKTFKISLSRPRKPEMRFSREFIWLEMEISREIELAGNSRRETGE